jgi:hypothetical protein
MRGSAFYVIGASSILVAACSSADNNCTVVDNGDGTATIACPDGTKTTIHSGQNGPAGDAGESGKSTLVRLDPEPAGKNCTYGGTAIKTGVDTNGDGVLEDNEVTSTSYVCAGAGSTVGTTIEGTYYIHNSFDVALLAGVTSITGDLNIDAPGLTGVSLPALTNVGGTVTVSNSDALVTLDLSALTHGDIQLGTIYQGGVTALTTLKLGALTGALNNFVIVEANALTTLNVPLVSSVAYMSVSGAVLASISLSALTSAETLNLDTLPALTNASFPKLTTVSNFTINDTALATLSLLSGLTTFADGMITNNASLTSISALAGVTGTIDDLSIQSNPLLASLAGLGGITAITNGITVTQCAAVTSFAGLAKVTTIGQYLGASNDAALTTIGAPALTTVGDLEIDSDASLTALDLDKVTTVSNIFTVADNPLLKQCLADTLLAQLTSAPAYTQTVNNDGVGTCP